MPNQNKTPNKYNFDRVINRESTACIKYDLRGKIFGKTDVLPMWVADMDFETPDFIREAIEKRSHHSVFGYSFRTASYYKSITNWVENRHGWDVDPKWIVFSPGVVPALNFATLAFTEKGDNVIVQPPVYFPFFSAVKDNGRTLVNNELLLKNGKYQIDFEEFENQCKNAKMFFLSNPHNPVGRVWLRDDLIKLGEICVRNNVIIISDEIHSDLIMPDYKHIPIASLSEEIADITVTCIAPSKTFNVAGLATSSIIIRSNILRSKFEHIINKYHLNNGNIFGAIASEAGYTHGASWVDELTSYIDNNFKKVKQTLLKSDSKIKLIEPEATYLAWLDFRETGLSDKQVRTLLINKAKLGLSPGFVFGPGGSGFQRLNVAAPSSIVIDAVDRLTASFD